MFGKEETRAALCALNKALGYQPEDAFSLLDAVGEYCSIKEKNTGQKAAALYAMSRQERAGILRPGGRLYGKIDPEAPEKCALELQALRDTGCFFVGIDEDCYPGLLKECPDAPMGLYIKTGTPLTELFPRERRVAIVGTRDMTLYGKEFCERIVRSLGRCASPPTIVSGLAIGVDITAHMAAMENGLKTVAVLPCGIDMVYPWRHTKHAARISETEGCALITDYPPGTAPVAVNFLRRNRIIAGMSDSCLLVESKRKGGGMMTARLSSGYGRDVFVLPGRLDDIHSQGCLELAREKIAEVIDNPDTAPIQMGLAASASFHTADKRSIGECLDACYSSRAEKGELSRLKAIVMAVKSHRGITIEELSELTGESYALTAGDVGILESDGFLCTDLLQRCSVNYKRISVNFQGNEND